MPRIEAGLLMARIRSIKPEITESETLAELPIPVCWTFACLWPHCDDHGRRKAQPRLVKADLYPMRDDVTVEDVTEHLSLLAEADLICLYLGCDGKPYMHVVNWDEHQKVDRPSKTRVPPCREHDAAEACSVKGHDDCESSPFTLGLSPETASEPREVASSPLDTQPTGSRTLDLGPRTVDLGPSDLAPEKPSRKSDEIWDALLAACNVDQENIPRSARGAYNRATGDLRALEATPAEIRRRAAIYRGQWRDVSLTPTALVRRWAECERPPPPLALAPTRNDQLLSEARARAQQSEASNPPRKALP